MSKPQDTGYVPNSGLWRACSSLPDWSLSPSPSVVPPLLPHLWRSESPGGAAPSSTRKKESPETALSPSSTCPPNHILIPSLKVARSPSQVHHCTETFPSSPLGQGGSELQPLAAKSPPALPQPHGLLSLCIPDHCVRRLLGGPPAVGHLHCVDPEGSPLIIPSHTFSCTRQTVPIITLVTSPQKKKQAGEDGQSLLTTSTTLLVVSLSSCPVPSLRTCCREPCH